jgi:hypothetical protein
MKGYTRQVNGTKSEEVMRIGEAAYERAKKVLAEAPQPSAPSSLVDILLADIGNDRPAQNVVPTKPADSFADDLNTR